MTQQLTVEQVILEAKNATLQGNFSIAQKLYRAILQHIPNHPTALQELRNLQLSQKIKGGEDNISLFHSQANHLVSLYRSGQLIYAEEIGRQLLETYPQSRTILKILGAVLADQGHLSEAVEMFDKVIHLRPEDAEAHVNRGVVLKKLGQAEAAVTSYDRAIQLKPDLAEIHYSRANLLINLGRLEAAVDSYARAIQLKPDYVEAYVKKASALTVLNQPKLALNCYDQAIQLQPNLAEAYSNRGNVLRQLGLLEAAVSSYDQAIQLQPNLAEAYSNRGNAVADLGRLKIAVDSYDQAIRLNPDYAEAYSNRGNALAELERFEESLASYNQAITLKPDFAEAYSNRGNTLTNLGKLEEAMADCNHAIQLKPDYAKGYYCLGILLIEMGKVTEAIANYKRAIELEPSSVEAHWNLSLLLLLSGDLRNGWSAYEYGKLTKRKDKRQITLLSYPLWAGQCLEGKVILVQAEQGVGDEIMFASCIPDLVSLRPKKVILECDPRLAPIFKRSFSGVSIQYRDDNHDKSKLEEFGCIDFRVPIGDLPKFFRQDFSSFPSTSSFLIPNLNLRRKWKSRYKNLGNGMKIGLSWTGGAKGTKKRSRAPTLEQLLPILRLDAHFINLQYGDYTEELRNVEVSNDIHIHDWEDADPLNDLENQAAQIAELDLVISFDNATAQMAGSIGKKTWILVSAPPFWMYMLDRTDSPWYSSVRLFRQVENQGWESIIDDIEKKLSREIIDF